MNRKKSSEDRPLRQMPLQETECLLGNEFQWGNALHYKEGSCREWLTCREDFRYNEPVFLQNEPDQEAQVNNNHSTELEGIRIAMLKFIPWQETCSRRLTSNCNARHWMMNGFESLD